MPTAPSAAAATVLRGSAVWLPPGSSPVTVGDYVIAGGMFYVGSAAPAAYAATYEPALVDPRAPVRRVRLDHETPADGVRPAYGDLTPGARGAYLEWLASGRTDPTAAAHLWLFLYGLERRVLVDLAGTLGSQPEYATIAAELMALRERYPHVSAFEEQVTGFADLLDALIGLNDPALQPPPTGPRTDELPMRLRVGIGRYVARGLPISAGWAYAWYAYSARRRWGSSATRRPEEFRRAFAARYAEAYPSGGIAVPPPVEGLVLEYRPASPGFADRTVRIHTQLPDVRSLTAPLDALADVAARAEADMPSATPPWSQTTATPYADRVPHAGSAEGAPDHVAGQTWFAEPPRPTGAHAGPGPVADAGPGMAAGPVPQAAADPSADGYEVVIEPTPVAAGSEPGPTPEPEPEPAAGPDPAADGRSFTAAGAPAPKPHLAAAAALLRLVAMAGIADGYVRAVRRRVVDALGLTPAERHHLDDQLDEFAHRRPDSTVVRRRFAALAAAQQRSVTDLLIAAAGADGVVEPEHAAVLTVVFELLGPGAGALRERLCDLEVAAVIEESTLDVTVLDEEIVRHTLAGAVAPAAVVDALVAPQLSRSAACP